MKNLIGGLFETQEHANLAYEALQQSGFPVDDISMFIHRPRKKTEWSMQVSIQDIARNALMGGLLLGGLGALIGFLVGNGTLSLPSLEPGSAPRDPLFAVSSLLWGLITGGLTGAILGGASRLLRSPEKAEVMTRQIEKRGVLVTVHVEDAAGETRARRVLEEHKAVEIGNPREKWDPELWVSPNENKPSLANTR